MSGSRFTAFKGRDRREESCLQTALETFRKDWRRNLFARDVGKEHGSRLEIAGNGKLHDRSFLSLK